MTSEVRPPEVRSLLTDRLLVEGRVLGLVVVDGREEGLEISRFVDFVYPPLMLDLFEVLGLVVEGLDDGLVEGLVAGLL